MAKGWKGSVRSLKRIMGSSSGPPQSSPEQNIEIAVSHQETQGRPSTSDSTVSQLSSLGTHPAASRPAIAPRTPQKPKPTSPRAEGSPNFGTSVLNKAKSAMDMRHRKSEKPTTNDGNTKEKGSIHHSSPIAVPAPAVVVAIPHSQLTSRSMEGFLSTERVEAPKTLTRPPAQQMTSFTMDDVFANDSPRPQRGLATMQTVTVQPLDNRLLALKDTNAGHIDHVTGEWRSNDPIGPATINGSAKADNSDDITHHGEASAPPHCHDEAPAQTNAIPGACAVRSTRNEPKHEAIDRLLERIIIETQLQEYDMNESQPVKVLFALLNQGYDPETMDEIKNITRDLKIGWEMVRAIALMMDNQKAKLRLANHWANLIVTPHCDFPTQLEPELPFVASEQYFNSQSILQMTPGIERAEQVNEDSNGKNYTLWPGPKCLLDTTEQDFTSSMSHSISIGLIQNAIKTLSSVAEQISTTNILRPTTFEAITYGEEENWRAFSSRSLCLRGGRGSEDEEANIESTKRLIWPNKASWYLKVNRYSEEQGPFSGRVMQVYYSERRLHPSFLCRRDHEPQSNYRTLETLLVCLGNHPKPFLLPYEGELRDSVPTTIIPTMDSTNTAQAGIFPQYDSKAGLSNQPFSDLQSLARQAQRRNAFSRSKNLDVKSPSLRHNYAENDGEDEPVASLISQSHSELQIRSKRPSRRDSTDSLVEEQTTYDVHVPKHRPKRTPKKEPMAPKWPPSARPTKEEEKRDSLVESTNRSTPTSTASKSCYDLLSEPVKPPISAASQTSNFGSKSGPSKVTSSGSNGEWTIHGTKQWNSPRQASAESDLQGYVRLHHADELGMGHRGQLVECEEAARPLLHGFDEERISASSASSENETGVRYTGSRLPSRGSRTGEAGDWVEEREP